MTTILTEVGWENQEGIFLGTWRNQADLVDEGNEIAIAEGSTVNSLAGGDEITGTGETARNILFYGSGTVGIYNPPNSTINTNVGKDKLIATNGDVGIFNELNSTIDTGDGDDEITGTSSRISSTISNTIGILNDGTINTGNGRDNITATSGGIVNFGYIDTSNNDDKIIASDAGISNLGGGTIDTGNGRDIIDGTSSEDWGVYNGGFDDENSPSTISTGNGNDSIVGTSTIINAAGIAVVSEGKVDTGNGNDDIVGTGVRVGITVTNGGNIETGFGNDIITGTGDVYGISIGTFSDTPSTPATIDTGNGNDVITGIGGILNDTLGVINTGFGNDTVDALTGGFSGGGTIYLGFGSDLIRGFGEQIVDGGEGFDTAELGIDFDENQISFSGATPASIDITFDSEIMSFTDVELFNFNGQSLSLEQLQEMA